jgi:pilus assembly protein CpaE
MRAHRAQWTDSVRGLASVEFVGILPAALLVVLVGWQLLLAGQATWLAGNAARVAARAQAVGADPDRAARHALPSYLRRHLEVAADERRGGVEVRLRVPLIVEGWSTPVAIGGTAAMQRQVR